MKLLLDQNISFRVAQAVQDIFPATAQVRELGLENAKDIAIWKYASESDYTIVTFDADFYDLSLVKGIPPKIIWLRTGNLTTTNIEQLLRANAALIKAFVEDAEHEMAACLEIF